ncbi:MAG: hypothetical protein HKN27_15325, partial [Silicimonas sp.]|nr:hypothetical protein [Silicimonas sp.]
HDAQSLKSDEVKPLQISKEQSYMLADFSTRVLGATGVVFNPGVEQLPSLIDPKQFLNNLSDGLGGLRNLACFCSSGKRFKHCHGSLS